MSTPSSTPDPIHTILTGIWTGLSQNPWLLAVLALVITVALVRATRVLIHSGPRDEIRLFPRCDKATLLEFAGHRCEHHAWIGGRCRSTERLEADHVHPWSRGGWTHIANGQILCRAHNRQKSATIPWDRTLRRLDSHRAAYYPTATSRTVVRRRPPQRTASAP